MKVVSPRNPDIFIDSPLLDGAEVRKVEAVLVRYEFDGGEAPASFVVHTSWAGRRALVIAATVDGQPWAIML